MGKKGGSSWLTAVKRALTTRTTKHHPQQDDDDKKRERRRWLFRKSSNNVHQQKTSCDDHHLQNSVELGAHEAEEHAVAMAEVTGKAVSAAVIDHAAADVTRLTTATRPSPFLLKHHFAAIAIQTAFRGYLARRALGAMKGIVMLQAVIRGQNVRRQATITLKCMQALVRVQSRLHHQRSRLSHDGGVRKPVIPQTANSCDSKYFQDIRHRKSMSRDGSCIPDDWSDVPQTLGELDAILKSRKEANLSRETSLASAFSQQIWRSSRNPSTVDEKELEERANWLDRWIEAKQWESQRGSRASFDRRDSIKTVEMDSPRSDSRSATSVYKSSGYASHYVPNSPSRRSSYSPSVNHRPITPSPIRTRPLQVRSASPRCMRDDRTYENAHIQSLRSTPRVNGSMCHYTTCTTDVAIPNYMAATESAKARVRSQSTPRQRPSTPERERAGSAKKRLAYPGPDPSENGSRGYSHNHLRSPSFKSVQVGHVGMGCYADSTGGEISPCSTTDLRRWLG